MFSKKKSNSFKNFVENTNKLAQTLQPQKSNTNQSSIMKKHTITINAPSNTKDVNDYPSNSRDYDGRNSGEGHSNSSNSEPSGYFSNSGQYCGTYTQKYAVDVSSALVAIHGSRPSLVLGFNPSILAYQKDTDGVSKQTKGLINDLNYQLTVTGFQDPKGIILAHCDQTDVDMGVLVQTLQPFAFNLTVIDFSNNRLGDVAVENLFYTMGTHQTPAKYVQSINLSNNFIGDYGANYIAQSLMSGRYPSTKHFDISGNNITNDGDTKLMEAAKGLWNDFAIFTHKLDEIVKMGEGTKEEKITIYKAIVEKGKSLGTYDKAMVVDKSWWGKISHSLDKLEFKGKWLFGFGKCHVVPDPKEEVTSYAQDKIIATLPAKTATGLGIAKKGVGVLTKHYDFVTCFISTTDSIWSSELGQQIAKHELCLLGEQDFCNGEQ